MLDYIRDGQEIYRRSFATIRAEADLSTIPPDMEKLAVRVIHACGMVNNRVICTLHEDGVPDLAKSLGNTRSAAALEHWRKHLEGSVVVIGNAPTALFYLLEMLDAGAPKPALIIGMPVGFIGAAESKDALAADSRGVPYVVVRGRRGGSAMAVAAVNAIATEVE
jgi:precorrin-8X/cobalt-precorrin-8 methylmutase